MHLELGERVVVSAAAGYAEDALATIRQPPQDLVAMNPGWVGHYRELEFERGKTRIYWVEFDQPQRGDTLDESFTGAMVDWQLLTRVK